MVRGGFMTRNIQVMITPRVVKEVTIFCLHILKFQLFSQSQWDCCIHILVSFERQCKVGEAEEYHLYVGLMRSRTVNKRGSKMLP